MQGGKITQFASPSFALENRNVNTGAGGWCSAGELCCDNQYLYKYKYNKQQQNIEREDRRLAGKASKCESFKLHIA